MISGVKCRPGSGAATAPVCRANTVWWLSRLRPRGRPVDIGGKATTPLGQAAAAPRLRRPGKPRLGHPEVKAGR